MHLKPPRVLHVPSSWPQVGAVRPKRGRAAAVARAVQRARADRACGHGGGDSCWKPPRTAEAPCLPPAAGGPGRRQGGSGGGRRRRNQERGVRQEERPHGPRRFGCGRPPWGRWSTLLCPLNRTLTSSRNTCAELRRNRVCRAPVRPSAPSVAAENRPLHTPKLRARRMSGVGSRLILTGFELLTQDRVSRAGRDAGRRSRRDRGPCFYKEAAEVLEPGR